MPANFVSNPNCPTNFLSGIGFQFQLNKFPEVAFYCQSANVPGLNLSVATQATRFNAIPQPGDEISYDDLNIKFLVDEKLKNYKSIHNWIRALGHPYNGTEFNSLLDGEDYDEKTYSDGTLFILDSNFNKKLKIVYKDLFPTSLSGLNFDSTYTDTEYFAVDASFKYTIYDIEDISTASATAIKPTVAPTVSLTSNVTSTEPDSTFLLKWTSKNADSVSINNGIGEVDSSGTIPISTSSIEQYIINNTITYTITATGRGGTVTDTVTITLE